VTLWPRAAWRGNWATGLLIATAAATLVACAQAPLHGDAPGQTATEPAASPSLQLQGQMGIKLGAWGQDGARGMSFGFFFQGQVERGSLSLMTPLGSQVAQVDWGPESASLRRIGPGGGEELRRGSIDELAQEALGEALPLQTLIHWMQGQADPALPHQASDQSGVFEQLGWQVDTHELAQGRLLATRQGQPGQRDARIVVRLDP